MSAMLPNVVADERVPPGTALLVSPSRLVDVTSENVGPGVVKMTATYERPSVVAIVNLAEEPKP